MSPRRPVITQGPGERVATITVPGGTAALHERVLALVSCGTTVTIDLPLPTIDCPSMVTPSASLGALEVVAGTRPLADVERDVRAAVDGRLALRATGTVGAVQPLSIGRLVGTTLAMSADLTHRTLYDVVALDDSATWRVIASRAFYARTDWRNLGIAHITSAEMARRLDGFHDLIVPLRRTGPTGNRHDRVRDFICDANRLHAEGVLDVIVANCDLYDHLAGPGVDRSGGCNAELVHDLLHGHGHGSQEPDVDVDVLRVPILTVPSAPDHPGDPDGAARVLAIDRVNAPYRRSRADTGSYVVELSAHRLAMLARPPAHAGDLGVVTAMADGLRSLIGPLSEHERSPVRSG